jgi:A/G-specific adenine glycosylase
VGDYTAGAIASIALYMRAPAVDGNVFRVISRLSENPTDISEPKYRPYLSEKLLAVYPEEGIACSEFTQSLMELGALVCKPQNPDCEACPLKSICESYRHGTQGEYPVLPEKKAKRREQVCVLIVSTPDGIAISKRTTGVLKGMNEFPSFVGKTLEESAKELKIERFELIKSKKYTHIFTHIVWEMAAYLIKTEKVGLPCYSRSEIEEKVSLPTAFKQCLSILDGETGANE